MGGKRGKRGCTVDDVRALTMALPDTEEKPSYGTPGFRVGGKLFARVLDDESIVVWVELDQRDVLVASAPNVFAVTPHYQGYPMVIVRLATVGRELLEEMLAGAWRLRAPRKLIEASRPPLTPARGGGSGSRSARRSRGPRKA